MSYEKKYNKGNWQNRLLFPVVYSNSPLSICADTEKAIVEDCHDCMSFVKEEGSAIGKWKYLTVIYKRECWSYEKEWRLVKTYGRDVKYIPEHFQIWEKPKVIYYGKDVNVNDEIRLQTYALMNGLEEYRMEYVCADGNFVLKPVPYKCEFEDQCRNFIRYHYKVVLMSRVKHIDEYLREMEKEYGITRPSSK